MGEMERPKMDQPDERPLYTCERMGLGVDLMAQINVEADRVRRTLESIAERSNLACRLPPLDAGEFPAYPPP